MVKINLSLLLVMFFAVSGDIFAQQGRENLADAVIMLGQQKALIDSMVLSLIQIKEDSLTNDSVKVEIVYFLAELACDTCLLYLIEHMNDRFIYGSDASDIEEFNLAACWSLLGRLAKQEKKWKVLSMIFYSLELKPRDDYFYEFIIPVALRITSKAAIRSIIEDKLSKNSTKRNKFYTKNLTQFLENLR